jgi:hypothetical protein
VVGTDHRAQLRAVGDTVSMSKAVALPVHMRLCRHHLSAPSHRPNHPPRAHMNDAWYQQWPERCAEGVRRSPSAMPYQTASMRSLMRTPTGSAVVPSPGRSVRCADGNA